MLLSLRQIKDHEDGCRKWIFGWDWDKQHDISKGHYATQTISKHKSYIINYFISPGIENFISVFVSWKILINYEKNGDKTLRNCLEKIFLKKLTVQETYF